MCLTDCKGVTKMSKRFNIAYGGNVITDKDGRDLNLSVKWCVEELVGLLNEQQATISQLKEENEQLKLTLSEYGVDLKAFEIFKQKIGYYKVIDDE